MRPRHAALAALLLTGSSAALAINEGFETGNVTGFGGTVPPGASAEVVTSHAGSSSTYSPARGHYFLELKTNGPDRFTQFEQRYRLKAGEFIKGYAAFDARERSSDPAYNDYAEVHVLNDARQEIDVPWYADVAGTGATGDGPWTPWKFTAPADGTYIVEYRIINRGDDDYDSYALFDGDELHIDIKPGSASNFINPAGWGFIPVAILADSDLPLSHLDRDSIRFGDMGDETRGPSTYHDFGGDGAMDLLSVFKTSRTGISCLSGTAFLTARLWTGQYISGGDTVVVPPGCD